MDTLSSHNVQSTSVSNIHSRKISEGFTWKVGQLAWARLSVYPFWPCVVTYDPNAPNKFQKVQDGTRRKLHMIHVHFFNDNGQHSWIPLSYQRIFPFFGIEHFKQRANLVTAQDKKLNPKYASAFVIKSNLFKKWQIAVAEASDVLYEIDLTPLEIFKPKMALEDTDQRRNSINKRSGTSIETCGKRFKKVQPIQLTNKNSTSFNLETSPKSSVQTEDMKKNSKKEQKKLLQPPDFEVYYNLNAFFLKEAHPEYSDSVIRQFLEKSWNELPLKMRQVYRSA